MSLTKPSALLSRLGSKLAGSSDSVTVPTAGKPVYTRQNNLPPKSAKVSTQTPLRHSTASPLPPLHHSTTPPFRRSTATPLRHAARRVPREKIAFGFQDAASCARPFLHAVESVALFARSRVGGHTDRLIFDRSTEARGARAEWPTAVMPELKSRPAPRQRVACRNLIQTETTRCNNPVSLYASPLYRRGYRCTLLSALCPSSHVQLRRWAHLLDGTVPS